MTPLRTGILVNILLLAGLALVINSGLPTGIAPSLPWSAYRTVNVQLQSADALEPKADVEIGGVKVGTVYSIQSDSKGALVSLHVTSQDADIRQDAHVALRAHGLFGPQYIEITPGAPGSPLVRDGGTIAAGQTSQPVDLDQILQDLNTPEQNDLRTVFIQLGLASAGQGDTVNHLIGAADSLTQSLQVPVSGLDHVTSQLNTMLVDDESFNRDFAQAPLDQLVASSETVFQQLAANASNLEALLVHADSSLGALDTALSGESGNLQQILDRLPGTINQLDTFNNLIGLFGANLTGKDGTVANDSNVTQGIIAAIENPKSAFFSYDSCKPGTADCLNGQDHYLRVQVFNLDGSGNAVSENGFPLCVLRILDAPPGSPTALSCAAASSGAASLSPHSIPGLNLAASGDGMAFVAAMLRA
jgi:virulence factor Mce-like protein